VTSRSDVIVGEVGKEPRIQAGAEQPIQRSGGNVAIAERNRSDQTTAGNRLETPKCGGEKGCGEEVAAGDHELRTEN
jgi:hypothetical protein